MIPRNASHMPDTAIKSETQQQQPQELETVRSEKFIKIYANAANLEMTPWDFNIIFGELKKSNDKVVIEQSVAITMSPQHAKALAGVLVGHVKQYEKMVGEINLPQPPENQTEQSKPMAVAGLKTN